MGILGITNRTENWKTACHFAPLFGDDDAAAKRRVKLAAELLPAGDAAPQDTSLELFWYGLRDYLSAKGLSVTAQQVGLAYHYRNLFDRSVDLRARADEFTAEPKGFRKLKPKNYDSSQVRSLRNNLRNTEVDIVLESPTHLFIGEAKHESRFGASGGDVLTHQLIRQYVMARILIEMQGTFRRVVPFVVGNEAEALLKNSQVRFMIKQGWLREANILQWSDIEALW